MLRSKKDTLVRDLFTNIGKNNFFLESVKLLTIAFCNTEDALIKSFY